MQNRIGQCWKVATTENLGTHFVRYERQNGKERILDQLQIAEPTEKTHACGGQVYGMKASFGLQFHLCKKCGAEVIL